MFAGDPAVENVTLCTVLLPFDHVTVPPRVIATLAGENANTALP